MTATHQGNTPCAGGWVSLLLLVPWIHPWAPSPQSNTLPVLISWACMGLLAVFAQGPAPLAIARAWVWAALVSSAMGLFQYFGVADIFGGLVHVPVYLGDAVGNLRQRNQLASLTSIGVVAVLWWQTQGLRLRHAAWMLALLAVGNAATGSRTGLLEMALIALLCMAWAMGHRASPWRLSWRWSLAALALCFLALCWVIMSVNRTETKVYDDLGGADRHLFRRIYPRLHDAGTGVSAKRGY